MSEDLEKLGTVLAVSNQIQKDMLDVVRHQQDMLEQQNETLLKNYTKMESLLEGQQKRQASIIVIAIVSLVAVVVCSCVSFNKLAGRIDAGIEVLRNEHIQAAGTKLPR